MLKLTTLGLPTLPMAPEAVL